MFAASKTAAAAAGTPPPSTDPQFNYVTMLLHGDGTNGAQNNTFVDSSTNNFTITRNGTPTQGSFSPYGTLWSNNFSSIGQFLTLPSSSTAWAWGTSSYTIELWVYPTDLSSNRALIAKQQSTSNDWELYLTSTGGVNFRYWNGSQQLVSTAGSLVAANRWTHIAFVNNAGAITIYVSGVSSATGTVQSGWNNGNLTLKIGQAQFGTNPSDYLGYMSNVRLVNGTAIYTSNFTPSTTPLTAVSGTSLLTCQSNRFRDNSSNNFAITVTGTPSVQRFSPFDPAAEYSTSVIGGSGYFGTSGQSVQAASNAVFTFGTGDFTVEYFVYATSWSSSPTIVDLRSSNPSSGGYSDYYSTAGKFNLYWATTTVYTSAATLGLNQWYHIAVSRSGSTVRVFVNGVLDGTFTNAFNFTDSNCRIGANTNTTPAGIVGYLSNARIVKGTAVYTAAFTPPTAPLTAITNTSLLLNTVNAGIVDNAMMNDLVTVGNAQISTSVKKYGTGSMAFDGTGDWLTFVDSPNVQLGAGDFTIEGWVYLSALGTARGFLSKGTSTTGFSFGVNALNQLVFNYTATSLTATTPLLISTWYYVAVVRSGSATGNLKIYLNGSVDATSGGAVNDNFNQTSIGYVGADRVATSPMNGYIDDLRITKGIARTITTPTAAFPNN